MTRAILKRPQAERDIEEAFVFIAEADLTLGWISFLRWSKVWSCWPPIRTLAATAVSAWRSYLALMLFALPIGAGIGI